MKKKNPILFGGFVLLGIVVIAALFFLLRYSNQPKVKRVTPHLLVEGKNEMVHVQGKNFPGMEKIKVNFSGIPGVIKSSSRTHLEVWADIEKMKVGKPPGSFSTNMAIMVNGKRIKLTTITVAPDKTIVVNDYSPKIFWTGATVKFTGKNLENSQRLKVQFAVPGGSRYATIKTTASKNFSVTVPAMPIQTTNIPQDISITVFGDDQSVFKGHGGIKKKPQVIDLNNITIINPNN